MHNPHTIEKTVEFFSQRKRDRKKYKIYLHNNQAISFIFILNYKITKWILQNLNSK